ncbi:MAG: HNH endonuclease [Selenomonadaceae bacterium]|nr:HNH endonuclease [Selenomonadaceae bacterium]
MGRRKSNCWVEMTPEREAVIRARRHIKPDAPDTKPGDLGNGHVLVVDERTQKFNGRRYRRTRSGYFIADKKNEGKIKAEFLHVAVWQFHNGDKPDGSIVHHDRRGKDGNWDTSCNDIEWLLLMTHSEHKLYHSKYNPSLELVCENCHQKFWGRSRVQRYCSNCSSRNDLHEEHIPIMSLEDVIAADNHSADSLQTADGDKVVRICFFCHRPFETDIDSMEVACNRSDCRGREVAAAYDHAMNNVVRDLTEHCGCFFKFFSQRFDKPIRCLYLDGEIWFIAIDVAKTLGYKDPSKAVRAHVKPAHRRTIDRTDFFDRKQATASDAVAGINKMINVIDEPGFYRLCSSSKLPEAEAFIEWVTGIVLPAIRKYGQYVFTDMAAPVLLLPEDTSLVLVNAADEPFCFSDDEDWHFQFGMPVSRAELVERNSN